MLKIVDKLPKDTNWGRRSCVENDIVTFMNSHERYASITIPGRTGQKVKDLAAGWLRRRNVTSIRTRVVDGTCYLINEEVPDNQQMSLRAVV